MCRIMVRSVLLGAVASCWLSISVAQAAEPPEPYDALTAGRDAYYYHEARRRQAIATQLATIDRMKWFAGFPAGGIAIAPGYGQTIYYRDPPSLDYIYATGRSSVYTRYPNRAWPGLPDVFEPWPLVPGDIWGYPYYDAVPQPIGQRQVQTGPKQWESHPVYATPIDAGPLEAGLPEAATVDAPPIAVAPRIERPIPRRLPLSGPREF